MPINSLLYPANSAVAGGFEVANSLRFNRGSSDKLNRSTGVTTTNTKFTLSFWLKLCDVSNFQSIFQTYKSSSERFECGFNLDNSNQPRFVVQEYTGSYIFRKIFTRLFRDTSAWYHFVIKFDSSEAEANRLRVYINGIEETATDTVNLPSSGASSIISVGTQNIGYSQSENGQYFNGYLAEFVLVEATDYAPTDFGEFDEDSGIWKPIDVSGLTFGTNGFYLPFLANGTNAGFVDFSSNARAITVTGNVHHSFDQAKFEESSIEFDGTNDSLDIADSTDFDFGTGNFTFEFWVYKTANGKMAIFETRSTGSNNGFNLEFNNSGAGAFEWYDESIASGGDLPKDGSAISLNTWTHYAVVRNGAVCTMYKNGTSVGTPKNIGSNSQVSAGTPTIGESASGANDYQGYLDEIRLSNTARYTGNFTVPSAPFTSDSNTVLLIQSKASNLLGGDNSGEGNHFTTNNLTLLDQSTDTCTNNFATFNPLYKGSSVYSEGNLKNVFLAADHFGGVSTIGVATGKWYAEFKILTSGGEEPGVGITGNPQLASNTNQGVGEEVNSIGYRADGSKGIEDTFSSYGASYTTNDIIGVALDLTSSTQTVEFFKNGASQGAITISLTPADGVWFMASNSLAAGLANWEANFGSPPFAISSSNADGNGFGNFEYAVPSGYFSLNTKNLAEYG